MRFCTRCGAFRKVSCRGACARVVAPVHASWHPCRVSRRGGFAESRVGLAAFVSAYCSAPEKQRSKSSSRRRPAILSLSRRGRDRQCQGEDSGHAERLKSIINKKLIYKPQASNPGFLGRFQKSPDGAFTSTRCTPQNLGAFRNSQLSFCRSVRR